MTEHQNLGKIKKVLIIRFDKFGDMIASTPAIRGIRSSLPEAEITLLTWPYTYYLLHGWEVIDKTICYDPAWGWRVKVQFIRQLRANKYDLAVVMSPKMVGLYQAWLSGTRLRLGKTFTGRMISTMLTPFLLTHQMCFPMAEDIQQRRWIPHEAQQLLRTIALIGLAPTERPFEIPLPKTEQQAARQLLTELLPDGSILIGVHLSGKWIDEG